MQSRALLMKEHRLIERMLVLLGEAAAGLEAGAELSPRLVADAVDFIRTYADRTHHGKEEDILFAELAVRPLSEADRRAMEALAADHAWARGVTAEVALADERRRAGDAGAVAEVVAGIRALCDFYPRHIAAEDASFFPAARSYFSEEEDRDLLARYRTFDQAMIHEKYAAVVAAVEKDVR